MQVIMATKNWLAFVVGLSALGFYFQPMIKDILAPQPCAPSPQIKMLSHEPFVVHISDFVSPQEVRYLQELA